MVSNMTLSQNMVEEEIGDAGPLSLGDFVSWKDELTELLTMPSKNERRHCRRVRWLQAYTYNQSHIHKEVINISEAELFRRAQEASTNFVQPLESGRRRETLKEIRERIEALDEEEKKQEPKKEVARGKKTRRRKMGRRGKSHASGEEASPFDHFRPSVMEHFVCPSYQPESIRKLMQRLGSEGSLLSARSDREGRDSDGRTLHGGISESSSIHVKSGGQVNGMKITEAIDECSKSMNETHVQIEDMEPGQAAAKTAHNQGRKKKGPSKRKSKSRSRQQENARPGTAHETGAQRHVSDYPEGYEDEEEWLSHIPFSLPSKRPFLVLDYCSEDDTVRELNVSAISVTVRWRIEYTNLFPRTLIRGTRAVCQVLAYRDTAGGEQDRYVVREVPLTIWATVEKERRLRNRRRDSTYLAVANNGRVRVMRVSDERPASANERPPRHYRTKASTPPHGVESSSESLAATHASSEAYSFDDGEVELSDRLGKKVMTPSLYDASGISAAVRSSGDREKNLREARSHSRGLQNSGSFPPNCGSGNGVRSTSPSFSNRSTSPNPPSASPSQRHTPMRRASQVQITALNKPEFVPDYQQRLLESRGLTPPNLGQGHLRLPSPSRLAYLVLSPMDGTVHNNASDSQTATPILPAERPEVVHPETDITLSAQASGYMKDSRSPLAKKIAAILDARRS